MPDADAQSGPRLQRRDLLRLGGFCLIALPGGALAIGGQEDGTPGQFNAYLRITPDDEVIIVTPGAEMGQGIINGLPKILAEELDADWDRVTVQLSGEDSAFRNAKKRQRSANSDGITSYYDGMRRIGATARAMLVQAAAQRWGIPPSRIDVRKGRLLRRDGTATLSFGAVAQQAARLPVPEMVPHKNSADFILIGKDTPRKDIPAKVAGTAQFGMDVVLPGMLHACIRHVPVAGARIASVDSAKAAGMPGVRKIVVLDDAVGVIADGFWQARNAAETIAIAVADGDRTSSEALREAMLAALGAADGALPFPVAGPEPGKSIPGATAEAVAAVMTEAPISITQDYEVPYLAHATMEPLCSTALVKADSCEIWAPTQAADVIPGEMAAVLGLPTSAIKVHRTFIGGGFGRKNDRDFIRQSVLLARAVPGRPVKLIWPREEDMRNDYYRPAFAARTSAAVAKDGRILAMQSRIAGQSLTSMTAFRVAGRADASVASELVPGSYPMDMRRIEAVETDGPLRTGYWRSVSQSHNLFFSESMIDEIASALHRDPLAYRLWLTRSDPRSQAVLTEVRDRSGWTAKPPAGTGRGIALGTGWGSRCAWAIEVEIQGATLALKSIHCAFDCGQQIEPDTIRAQIEGGIVFGLSAALFGKITLKDGMVEQSNFSDYPLVILRNCPPIEVRLIASDAPAGGVGEAGVPGVAPALAGAIFAATGKRIRRLPLLDNGLEMKA